MIHKYKKKDDLVISVMEVLHPKVLFFICTVRCKMDSVEHVFPSFDGLLYNFYNFIFAKSLPLIMLFLNLKLSKTIQKYTTKIN